MNCPNCGAALSCGCQKRIASNGKQCCTHCIGSCNKTAGSPAVPSKPGQVSYPPGPVRK